MEHERSAARGPGNGACARFGAELAAHAYGELDPARRAELSGHLEQCAGCAAELEALRELRAGLDLWQVPVPREDAAALAAEVRARAGRERREPRLGPERGGVLRGIPRIGAGRALAAAAGLLLLALLVLGGSARVERGTLTLAWRAPWRAADASFDPSARLAAEAELEARLLAAATQMVDERTAGWAEGQAAWLHALGRAQEERLFTLARGFDEARQEDLRLVAAVLEQLGARAASEDRRTRAALADLALAVAERLPERTLPTLPTRGSR